MTVIKELKLIAMDGNLVFASHQELWAQFLSYVDTTESLQIAANGE